MIGVIAMGKYVPNSNTTFHDLKAFTDAYYEGSIPKRKVFSEAYKLLGKYNIKLRQKDGKDPKITVSIPSKGSVIVIGIRYTKLSGRKTEDHFIFRPNENLYKCKGKELERIFSEYNGSHELQR